MANSSWQIANSYALSAIRYPLERCDALKIEHALRQWDFEAHFKCQKQRERHSDAK
jgi:hypothetical protein